MSASNKRYQFISVLVVKLLSETSSTKFSLSSVSFFQELLQRNLCFDKSQFWSESWLPQRLLWDFYSAECKTGSIWEDYIDLHSLTFRSRRLSMTERSQPQWSCQTKDSSDSLKAPLLTYGVKPFTREPLKNKVLPLWWVVLVLMCFSWWVCRESASWPLYRNKQNY